MPLDVPGDSIPAQTEARLQRAGRLAEKTLEMVSLAPPAGAKQPAFVIARCVLAHALDYDACVLPCSTLLPHARRVDELVLRIVAATVDEAELPASTVDELQLPVRHGGMQVTLPSLTCPLARAARLMETGPHIRQTLRRWLAEEESSVDIKALDEVTEAENEGCLSTWLLGGSPASLAQACPQLRTAGSRIRSGRSLRLAIS